MVSTALPPAGRTDAPRGPLWRTPADQPRYARPALLAIAVCAGLLYAWDITSSPFHGFYANAARSMSESWKAFFFGSFDPGNSITIDKVPGFLWPQALSARLFGFHSWALTLPQALEGVASVLVLYRAVRRWAGANAALLASGVLLFIPAADGLFRTQSEDPLFTLCLLLAADATQRAARGGRLRSLVLAGVWVGVGFQAKMLEAWAVLPALAVVYLVSAPVAMRKRLAHLGVAALVMVAVSASWVVAVTLTPAKDRPYIDGTTNNSAFSMVVGYNFLNRFSSVGLNAGDTGSISATQGGGHRGMRPGGERSGRYPAAGTTGRRFAGAGQRPGSGFAGAGQRPGSGFAGAGQGPGSGFAGAGQGRPGGGLTADGALRGGRTAAPGGAGAGFGAGENGWGKMFGSALASQTGWLYPLAAIAVAGGLLWRRGTPRTDPVRAGFLLWGTWLATFFLVFSAGSVGGHIYYMGVIAVPSAALAGGGLRMMWRAYRGGGRGGWVLPAAIAATAAWSAYLSAQFPSFDTWLVPATALLALAAVVALVLARPGARPVAGGRVAFVGLLAGLAAILVAPGAWAAQIFTPGDAMTSMMGSVGPSSSPRRFGPQAQGRGGGFGRFGSTGRLTAQQQRLLDYTGAHRGASRYDFAATSWSTASPYIVDAGADVLPMGGFTGQVPFPTVPRFRDLVDSGALRYVLVGGSNRFGAIFGAGTPGAASTTARITDWVKANCQAVPAASYGGTAGSAASPDGTGVLYRCAPAR